MIHTQQNLLQAPRQLAVVALTGLMLIASAGVSTQSTLASQISKHSSNLIAVEASVQLPRSVEQAIRRDLSQRLNIPLRDVTIVRFAPQTWSDGCLGLGGAAENCLQALVEGWRIEVTANQQAWIYRTDKTANAIRLEPESTASLPPIVSQRLLRQAARDVRVPVARLRIAEVKSAVWDGCLGIFTPGQGCTKIALQGWQVIVVGNNRSWVYHLDRDGDRIAQNPTASGSRGRLVPSFIPEENKSQIEANVILRSTVSGDLTGRVTQTTLTTDGAITQLITAPNIRSRPVVIKRLSQQQVEQFQQVLEAQRFLNFNGLSYLSEVVLADYPTTTLQSAGSMTQYVDLETPHLPRAFQQVIQAWTKLHTSKN